MYIYIYYVYICLGALCPGRRLSLVPAIPGTRGNLACFGSGCARNQVARQLMGPGQHY